MTRGGFRANGKGFAMSKQDPTPAYSAAELFNCCTEHQEPDWSRFKTLILGGCKDDPEQPGHTLGMIPAPDAQFFTVYGQDGDGICEAITDVRDARLAMAVAAALAVRAGLYVTLSVALARF